MVIRSLIVGIWWCVWKSIEELNHFPGCDQCS